MARFMPTSCKKKNPSLTANTKRVNLGKFMKKLITDQFDKLLMFLIFAVIFSCAIIYRFEWLFALARDAFLVLTALLGFRRSGSNAPVINAENSTVSAENKPVEYIG